jgi:hypothetical protein
MDPDPDSDPLESSTPNHHRFYGNEGTDLSLVYALRLRSFKDLVDRKLNIASTLNVTRRELQAMTKNERHRAKRVPYVTPCCFIKEESRRLAECATVFNLICLDLDEEADGSCPAAPYVNAPEVLQEQLMPFNFAAYTTVSSTPKKPRLRIMVEANGIGVNDYRLAVDMIAHCIGLGKVTKESYVYVQPMYLPTICKGDDEDDDHPLIAFDINGRAVTKDDLRLFRRKQLQKGKGENDGYSDDWNLLGDKPKPDAVANDLEFLRPTVEDIGIESVKEALEHLDPDMTYPEWLEIAAGIRHQFQGNLAEKAYRVFDKWSAKGDKYAGADDTRAKWDSLRPTPIGRAPVTIRTVLTKAAQAGWNSAVIKDRCFMATMRWLQDPERTASDLLGAGLGRVLATPLITQSEEEALLNQIVEVCKRRWAMRITTTTVRKDMMRLKQKIANESQKRKGPAIPGWAKGLCYVAATNEFYRHSTRERFKPESLDATYSRKLLLSEEQIAAAGQQGSMKAASKPVVDPRDYLLNVVKIPTVYDYIYDPRYPNDTFLDLDDRPYVNLYVPNHPEPRARDSLFAGEMLMEHLGNLISERPYQRTVLDFMAFLVQYPGKKIRWAILLQGVEGCGKTFLSEAMKTALGRGHVRTIDSNALHSTWNDWAYGSQLLTLEEIRVAGHSRHEVMNALKPLVTNDVINLNQRHRDSRQVDNTANYMLFTNHHDSLVLSHGDRRYFVLKSPLQTKGQVMRLGETYFRELFGMLQSHAPGLRHFLECWPISDSFDPNGHAPVTPYLKQLVNDSASELVIAVRDAIELNTHSLVAPDLVSSSSLLGWIQLHHDTIRVSSQQLAAVLRDEGYLKMGRFNINSESHFLWAKIGTDMVLKDIRVEATKRVRERLTIPPEDWELLQ